MCKRRSSIDNLRSLALTSSRNHSFTLSAALIENAANPNMASMRNR